MVRLIFSFKLDLGSYIVCIVETASDKLEALIHSMKFLSPKVALYVWLLVLPLVPMLNVASLNLCIGIFFGRCSLEFAQLVPCCCSWGRHLLFILIDYDFSIFIPRCYKDVCVNSFFPPTAKLRNYLLKECFN